MVTFFAILLLLILFGSWFIKSDCCSSIIFLIVFLFLISLFINLVWLWLPIILILIVLALFTGRRG